MFSGGMATLIKRLATIDWCELQRTYSVCQQWKKDITQTIATRMDGKWMYITNLSVVAGIM